GAQTQDSLKYLETIRFPLRQTHTLTHAQNLGFQYNPFAFLNLGFDQAVQQSLRSISVDTLFSVATFDSLGFRLIQDKTLQQAIDEGLIINPNNAVQLADLNPIPWLDVVKRYFSEGVRTDRSGETYTATLQPRLERIRSMNWLTIQPIAYSSRFQWVNGPAGLDRVGAAVSNNASIRGGVRVSPQELWRKFGWRKRLERTQKRLDDEARIEKSRREQEKRSRREAEQRRREAIAKGEEIPENVAPLLPLEDDTTRGGGFKLPFPKPTTLLRQTILALTSSRDLSVNLNRTWSGTSAHTRGGYSLYDSWRGQGPSMAYRMGLSRSIPVTAESRYIENQTLQITDRLQSSTQFGAKTDFAITQSLRVDFSWDGRSDERSDVTWRTVDAVTVNNTISQSGTVRSTVWAFGGNYEKFFEQHMAVFLEDRDASEAAGSDVVFDANEDGKTAFENRTLVGDFRQAFSNSLGTIGAKGFMPIPLPGWTISYTGLTNWPIIRWFAQSASLRHAYSATYDSDYRTNALAGFDEEGFPKINGVNVANYTIVYVIPGLEQGSVRINERFQPLLGLDINIKGGLQTGLTWSKSRSVSLSTGNADVNQNSSNDWSFRTSFSKRGLTLPFMSKLQNTVRFTLTFSRTKAVERRFRLKSDFDFFLTDNTDSETFLTPQLIQSIRTSMEPRMSYSFSSRLSADFFVRYEHISSQGSRVPTTTNIRSGFNIRVNIAN
ncbi:MAG: cell surface protein SprA, partial [Rhodothermia bacterium]